MGIPLILKLTESGDGKDIFVMLQSIRSVRQGNDATEISMSDNCSLWVNESAQEIVDRAEKGLQNNLIWFANLLKSA